MARASWVRALLRWIAAGVAVTILGVFLSTALSEAQTVSTWNGGAGDWSDCPPSGNALWDTCGDTPPVFPNGNYDAVINGGPVTMTSAAIVNLTINAGGSLLFATGTTGILTVTGSGIANNGTISIDSGNGLLIQGPSSLAISGSGSISIANSRFSGSGSPTVTLQQPIQGNGAFSLGMNLINQSTINATGGTLTMQPLSVVNSATFEASSGATLAFTPGGPVNFTNSGGTIKALAGGTVQLSGSTYSGGTLTTVGSGVIQTLGDAILNNLTNAGILQAQPTTVLEGTITNTGKIMVSSSTLAMQGATTLTGSGSVILSGSANLNQFTGSGSLTSQQLIHGSGTIYELPLTNQNVLRADSSGNTLYLSGGTTTNTATLEAANGGILELDTVVNNSGGTIEALNGSTVIFTSNFNGSINGGTLTTAGTGAIESENGVLDGTVNIPNNAGTLNVNNFELYLQGTINNTGTINLMGNSCIILNQPTTLIGSGKLTMGSGNCIEGEGQPFTNSGTIQGAGSIGDSNPMAITNNGTILANQTNPLTIRPNSSGFSNNGKLMSNAGATLTIDAPFNNLSGTGALTGGTYLVTGTIGVPGAITSNAAGITLTGASAEILNTDTLSNALSAISANVASGTLSLQSGESLTTGTSFANAGKITVGTGSSFKVTGKYTQTAGTTTVDGTLTSTSGVLVERGSLIGQGKIAGVLNSSASITPGDSSAKPAIFSVSGSYSQQAKGILDINVGGNGAGTCGELAVSNGVSLNGTLNIKLVNGFVPVVGNTFTIVSGSSVTGTFVTVNGESINSSEHFEVNYASNAVTLEVVSGP